VAAEKPQWRELFSEVVTSGLCTGCAACIIACPHPVLDYEADNGVYKPFHLDIDGGPEDCTQRHQGLHDVHQGLSALSQLGGRDRRPALSRESETDEEIYGIGDVLLARATDESLVENGQDGGVVAAC